MAARPLLWVSTHSTVIAPFPAAANSGQYSATGAEGSSRPRSINRLAQTAVAPLVVEKTNCNVSSA